MALAKKKEPVIEIPLTVFETAETKEDLDDWLNKNADAIIHHPLTSLPDDLVNGAGHI